VAINFAVIYEDNEEEDDDDENPSNNSVNDETPSNNVVDDDPTSGRLNQTHANQFKDWMEIKSEELFTLTNNFSGFKLLNDIYNSQLPKDANFSWINFTQMIIEISHSISEVYKDFWGLQFCVARQLRSYDEFI
jgi:hypothetical protein